MRASAEWDQTHAVAVHVDATKQVQQLDHQLVAVDRPHAQQLQHNLHETGQREAPLLLVKRAPRLRQIAHGEDPHQLRLATAPHLVQKRVVRPRLGRVGGGGVYHGYSIGRQIRCSCRTAHLNVSVGERKRPHFVPPQAQAQLDAQLVVVVVLLVAIAIEVCYRLDPT